MIFHEPDIGAGAVPVSEAGDPEELELDAVVDLLADRRRSVVRGLARTRSAQDSPSSESSRTGARDHAPPENSGLSPGVAKMLLSGVPGQDLAPRSAIDAVLGVPARQMGSMTPRAAAGFVTARIRALAFTGRVQEAVDLADREGMVALHRVAGWAQACTQASCYAILAEAYLFTGRLRDSAACARISLDYSREADDDRCVFRALSVLAAALACSGELTCAKGVVDEAMQIGAPAGWTTQYAAGWLLLADALIRSRSGDVDGVDRDRATLEAVANTDAVFRSITRFCNLVLQAARQEHREMIAAARVLTHGADATQCPPLLIDSALTLASLSYIHLGEPGRALAILEGRQSRPEHSVCFELVRATAYLHLGEFRMALEATEDCVAGVTDHSIITLTSVLLRRALAYEGLGLHRLADMEFSTANHLAFESGLFSATIGLPARVLGTLSARLALHEPEFAARIGAFAPNSADLSSPPAPDFVLPRLSARETVIAGWLLTDLSLPAIADELHVSINTVKSQVSALYRKLDVSSRAEATLHLRRTGLYQPADGAKDVDKNR